MIGARDHATTPPDVRIDELARILAEAILRARLRRLSKRNLAPGTRENELELVASSRTHGDKNGERT